MARKRKKIRELPEHVVLGFVETVKDPRATPVDVSRAVGVLIHQFTPLIFQSINRYKRSRRDLRDPEDLESAARIALVKAIQKFDPKMGVKFITFLQNGLHNELIGAYRKLVKQSSVEAINESGYFYKNDASENPIENEECERETITTEDSIENSFVERYPFAEDLVLNARLTIDEQLVFFMLNGISCDKYPLKEIKRIFPNYKIHLRNAEMKVYYYMFIKKATSSKLD